MRTRTHIAVFDTGPAFRSGSDIATLVLEPFIRALGSDHIELLIVSHADLDHAGGVNSLRRHFPISEFLGGEATPADPDAWPRQKRCVSGQAWRWDGVDFRILHPPDTPFLQGNDASCVLEISAGDQRVLLTGDIESTVERRLVAQGLLRPAFLVLMPHHGSRTSSSRGFVHALGAEVAIASAGFGNRWGFPRPEVVKRWQDAGAQVLTTATSGAISQRVCAASEPQAPVLQRRAYRRYWHAEN
jgi:competence protein ComEC